VRDVSESKKGRKWIVRERERERREGVVVMIKKINTERTESETLRNI